jgi:hypothetical protein
MTTNTGGPAFPCDIFLDGKIHTMSAGMTLRDYFAAKAMQGILSGNHPITKDADPFNLIASVAYGQADAMMKAREL